KASYNEKSENQFYEQSYEKHTFDLAPFMTAFPMLLETFYRTLSNIFQFAHVPLPHYQAPMANSQASLAHCIDYRLQPHCTLCEWFYKCYANALAKEDIQFLPGLTKGELLKLRKAKVTTIEGLHKTIEPFDETEQPKLIQSLFSSEEQKKLIGKSDAIINNRIILHKQRTRLFPSNIGTHFFIHIIKNPVSGLPAALGWLVMDDHLKVVETHVKVFQTDIVTENKEEQCSIWLEFADLISKSWNSYIIRGKGQHLFEFGSQTQNTLLEWAQSTLEGALSKPERAQSTTEGVLSKTGQTQSTPEPAQSTTERAKVKPKNIETNSDIDILRSREKTSFLWQRQPSLWSDIKKIVADHFYIPSPGTMSLFSIAEIFGCNQGIEPPESLFHRYAKPSYINPLYGNVSYEQSSDCNLPYKERSMEISSSRDAQLESTLESILKTMAELFKIVKPLLESQWIQDWKKSPLLPLSSAKLSLSSANSSNTPHYMDISQSKSAFTSFISEERRLKEEDILTLQELPLNERMEKFRSLGYLEFKSTGINDDGEFLYIFNTTDKTMPSKFRKGDFLKLVTHEDEDELSSDNMIDIQNGHSIIISEYDMESGQVSVLSRSGRLNLSKTSFYSLEEDIADFTEAKLTHAAEFIFSESPLNPVNQLLTGMWQYRQDMNSIRWIQKWIETSNHGLNSSQLAALSLPFQYKTSMIQGPPGTGKTHLLAWILISLVMHAFEMGIPLKIGISALTHQAIDNVLNKVVSLVNKLLPENFSGRAFPASCIKWGKKTDGAPKDGTRKKNTNGVPTDGTTGEMTLQGKMRKRDSEMAVEFSSDADEVMNQTWAIIGATGFGFYNMFNSRNGEFPEALDWVVFDEASQVLLPQALLTLIYGKGNFLFLGDVHQLPPIVLGNYDDHLNHSILSKLMALYPKSHQETLDITYRMNQEICDFPSRMWYQGKLRPASVNSDSRLRLNSTALAC
ncbi:MAG: AAA family ATPase, partial [Desulfamplus sp.]|nr:AAA family ATPase [Desulfamplus sp.]